MNEALGEYEVMDGPFAASVVLPLLPPPNRPDARPHSPDLLRRGLLKLLDDARGKDAVRLFHDERGKGGVPWTVSTAFPWRGRTWFRLTVLGKPLAALADALRAAEEAMVERGAGGAELLHGWRLANHRRWLAAGGDGSRGLAEPPLEDDGRLLLILLSPALGRAPGAPIEAPLDDPLRIVASWRRRWLGHADAHDPITDVLSAHDPAGRSSFLDWVAANVVAIDWSIEARAWVGPGGRREGAIGWFYLRVTGEGEPERTALRALCRFALFAGTGKLGSYGFGQTLALVGNEVERVPKRTGAAATADLHRPLW